jgi:hypothetical protein
MFGLFRANNGNKFVLLGLGFQPNSNKFSIKLNYISQDWQAHSWKTIPNTVGFGPLNLIAQDSSYLVGFEKCSNLKCSSCALKLDKNFNKISEKCSADLSFTNNAVISPTQNGYVLAHIVEHPNPFPKDSTVDLPSISSFDKNGNFLWKYFFRSHRYKEHVNIITAKNGDIIGVGQSEENSLKGDDYYGGGWIYRISPTGKLKWEKSIYDQTTPTIIGNLGVFYNVTETSDGGLLLVGFASDTFPNFKPSVNNIDTWIVKLDSSGCLKPNCGYEQQVASKDIFSYFEPIKTSVYPNPASKDLFFKIQDIDYLKGNIVFYDLNGRKITQFNLFEDQEEHRLDVSHIQNGVYLWQLILDDKIRQSGKVVVLKE